MPCGAETEANDLITSLTAGITFEIPTVDLDDTIFDIPGGSDSPIYSQLVKLTNDDLTTATLDGTGTFDILMRAFTSQIQNEFDKGRITGAEYAKAYTTLVQGAMSQAVQFLLGRDQAYWAAQLAQVQTITARVQLESAKVQLAQIQLEALNAEANYALTKMKLATESMTYCVGKYNLDNILPQNLELIKEQTEVQRSQTMDTRSDGVTAITGSVGQQKLLYAQQIVSYQRDAQIKASKPFVDAWITMKTIDEGLAPPEGFENDNLDQILAKIMLDNNFGAMIVD